jgi:hypothetical protein
LPKLGIKRDARELALKVLGVGLAVSGIVQDTIDVVEDGVPGDKSVRAVPACAVMAPELGQGPISDVVDAVACRKAITRDSVRASVACLEEAEIKNLADSERRELVI